MKRELRPSPHALCVMKDRGVEWREVVDTVRLYEVTDSHQGRRRFYRGPLCVVVAEDGTVVTVLLRVQHRWKNEDARKRGK